MKRIFILGILCLLLCSCGDSKKEDSSLDKEDTSKVTCVEMKNMLQDEDAILIDVRTTDEYKESHLDDAIHLDYQTIEKTIGSKVQNKDTKIIVYCRSGQRSAIARETLEQLGYTEVYDLGSIENCYKSPR